MGSPAAVEGLTPALKGTNYIGDIGDISCTDVAVQSGSLWGQERRAPTLCNRV